MLEMTEKISLSEEMKKSQKIETFTCLFISFWVAGIEPGTLCMVGRGSTTELHPQSCKFLSQIDILYSCVFVGCKVMHTL